MDITSLPSLSDFFEGADQWGEIFALLPVLVLLELILSADNAVALAAIARSSRQPEQERLALNLGIGIALLLRIALIVVAQWVLQNTWVQLLAAAYLVWLVLDHFKSRPHDSDSALDADGSDRSERPFLKTVLLLAFTDLAFSIDSVAAAVAISDQILLISAGAFIGIVALRFTSALFIRWLDLYPRLETAGFLAVAFVAFRLIVHVIVPDLNQPDWLTLLVVLVLFAWGMSIRTSDLDQDESHAC
jgi:YkoY family integral membrane protein